MTKNEILLAAEQSFSAFTLCCNSIAETDFFNKPATKWSVAENVQHLIISTNTTTLAFSLPKFIVRLVGGTPNRPSRTYEELVAKYTAKLAAGGAATGRFVPKPITIRYGKEKLMQHWNKAITKHLSSLNKTADASLDQYLVKHPLLGRITLRELCYFTIYHTQHHLNIISSRTAA